MGLNGLLVLWGEIKCRLYPLVAGRMAGHGSGEI